MSVKVQVILKEEEAAQFKAQALKESKSLSSWLRDAGKTMLEMNRQKQRLTDPAVLRKFFRECNQREGGVEPNWEDHKGLILEGYQGSKP